MKNKSKLAKIKAAGNKGQGNKLPDYWFLMLKKELGVEELKKAFSDDEDIEIWPEIGIMEIIIGEKTSIDVELLDIDAWDEESAAYLTANFVQCVYGLSFKKEDYEKVLPYLKKLISATDGKIVGDTLDFTPEIV